MHQGNAVQENAVIADALRTIAADCKTATHVSGLIDRGRCARIRLA